MDLFFLNGCVGATESQCYLTAHVYLDDAGICFSIQDGDSFPFYNVYDDSLYRLSRQEVISSDGLKEAFISEYQRLFNADLEIGSYLLVG